MKTNLFFSMAVLAAVATGSLQKVKAQSWNVGGNTVTQDAAVGTTNAYGLKVITNNAPRIYVAPAGSVGIGTSTPGSTLDVQGGNWDVTNNEGDFRVGNSAYRMKIGVAVAGGGAGDVRMRAAGGTSRLMLGTNMSDVLTLNGAGMVGIGTTSPGSTLDMLGGNWDVTNNEGDFRIGNPSYRMKIGVSTSGGGAGDVRMRAAGGTSRLMLGSNSIDVLTINGAGFVGIGNTSPQAMLDVSGDAYISGLTVGKGNGSNNFANSTIGSGALYSNTTGSLNTANGYEVLSYNTTGYGNTANGVEALYHNNGNYNTANGLYALWNNTTGNNNTGIGYYANVSTGGLTNSTAVGSGANVDASNKVRVGNTSVTSIGGQVGWTSFSDGRYKRNIKEDVKGLEFINALRPVTYNLDLAAINNHYDALMKNRPDSVKHKLRADMRKSETAGSKIVYNGLIAQEVEAAANKLNYSFSGVDKPATKDGLYGLRYSDFVVPLVKAMQELSKINDSLKIQNEQLSARLDKIEAMLSQTGNGITINNATLNKQTIELTGAATLSQNFPNPFPNSTAISYSLPAASSNAAINFYDMNGTMFKSEKLTASGKGNITLQANALPSGVYRYTLFVDGRMIDSKQMVIAK